MRRLLIGIALFAATTAGGIVSAGVARADVPATDDWPVRRTYASVQLIMYIDDDSYELASAGGCTPAATDDSCA